ncbi:MAG: class I SAM-dependent methyltransferase [Armatimonadota bacterium]
MTDLPEGLRIDLGCGTNKKPGAIGIDIQALPGVDLVLDLASEPLPFGDGAVAYVHASHFLEHLEDPTRLFADVSRVCTEGAQLELWTPYAGSNPGFVLGHKTFFTEDIYLHMCVWYLDFWQRILNARWILNEFQYIVEPATLVSLRDHHVDLDFALRHFRNVATEFCAHITVTRRDPVLDPPPYRRTFSTDRGGQRYEIHDRAAVSGPAVVAAVRAFARET